MNQVPTAATLAALVSEQAAVTPHADALIAGDIHWSYAELARAVDESAAALRALGVRPGDRVALLETNTARWPAIALGAHWLGARVEAFNTWVKAWDLDYLLRASGCQFLVMAAQVRSTDMLAELGGLLPELWDAVPGVWHSSRFPALRQVAVLGNGEIPPGAHRWSQLPRTPAPPAAAPEEVAFVLYTSGSTARPKAVPLRQRDTIVNAFHIGERMALTNGDRVWLGSPLFWSFGAANAMVATFSHGACLVLQDHFSAQEAADLMAESQCTAAYLLPSIVDALLPLAERIREIRGLRTGLTIGRPEEVERVHRDLGVTGICNVYGSTETYGNCCVTTWDAPIEDRLVSQGAPLPGVELRVVDEEGKHHYRDGLGELQVRGRIMPGYLSDPEANAVAFTADGWYRTGDQVWLRGDGAIEFRTRLTDMIKTSGINVAPAEVETFLCQHENVDAAAVVGAPHPTRGEVVVAFVTAHDDGLDAAGLRQFCRDGIAGYKVPWEIAVLDKLPSTETGKIKRRALATEAARLVDAAVADRQEDTA